MTEPFSEDFLGTIVNVGWGLSDILWINATVAGNYTVRAGASDSTGFMIASEYLPINLQSLETAIGPSVPPNSGQSDGAVWSYPAVRHETTTIGPIPAPAVIVDTANVTLFHAGIPNFDGIQVLGTITLFVDYNDPATVLHAQQEANQLAVQAGSRAFNNGYQLVTILSSHLGAVGEANKQVSRQFATNTFINLSKVKAFIGERKTFTFNVNAVASFSSAEGGANDFGVNIMTWGKRQATKAIPFSAIRKFPVFADGTVDAGSFPVLPVSQVIRTVNTISAGANLFTVHLDTLAIDG